MKKNKKQNKNQTPEFIKKIRLSNILSFGSKPQEIHLGPLNVLIGPNGSGKSNLIDVISVLQAADKDIADPVRKGGGVHNWLWKGSEEVPSAKIETVIGHPFDPDSDIRYSFSFTADGQQFKIADEFLERESNKTEEGGDHFYYRFEQGYPYIKPKESPGTFTIFLHNPQLSILSQRKDPDQFPEITWLGEQFHSIKIYREWRFGMKSILRSPQPADLKTDFLSEDCSNLGLILNKIRLNSTDKKRFKDYLKEFYAGIDDFDISVEGNTVQIFLQEDEYTIPAVRLSDGTLRYISLLAILCHPNPPPLICIEEPELGIHPDIILTLAELLVKASRRTQLIITTHSEALVDQLTHTPESVIVCEKEKDGTAMKRLSADKLKLWIEEYSLGELWRKGEIGGTRW